MGTFEPSNETDKSDFTSSLVCLLLLGKLQAEDMALLEKCVAFLGSSDGTLKHRNKGRVIYWSKHFLQVNVLSSGAYLPPTTLWCKCWNPLPIDEASKACWCLDNSHTFPHHEWEGQGHAQVHLTPKSVALEIRTQEGNCEFAILAHTSSPEPPPACVIPFACTWTLCSLPGPCDPLEFLRWVVLLLRGYVRNLCGCYWLSQWWTVSWLACSRWELEMLDVLNVLASVMY